MRNGQTYINGSLPPFVQCNFWFIFLFYPPFYIFTLPPFTREYMHTFCIIIVIGAPSSFLICLFFVYVILSWL